MKHVQNHNNDNYVLNYILSMNKFHDACNNSDTPSISSKRNKNSKLFIKPPKILLVEDVAIIQKTHTLFLEYLGCRVDLASDGFEAIELFQNAYDLILLDISLPSKNGLTKTGIDVTREIRCFEQETGTRRNTIIALTAFGDTLLDECIKSGCDAFYEKPLLLEALKGVLQHWLPKLASKQSDALNKCRNK